MFKSIGNALKRLFSSKSAKAKTNKVTATPIVIKENVKQGERPGVGGHNGLYNYFETSQLRQGFNKVKRNRAANKVARTSRNLQHRLAA